MQKGKKNGEAPVIGLPLVSVVVTNFNYGRYIGEALRSVVCQSYPEWECIIVDDHSTDDSVAVIESIVEELGERFRFIRLDRNLGMMGAAKAGFQWTTGTFVVFLDADDVLLPEFLREHVGAHLNGVFAAGVTGCDVLLIDEQSRAIQGTYGSVVRTRGVEFAPGFRRQSTDGGVRIDGDRIIAATAQPELTLIDRSVFGWHVMATSSLMFRRDLIELIMPDNDDDFRNGSDYVFYLLSHAFAGTIAIGVALSCYRLHRKNSFSNYPAIGGQFWLGEFIERNVDLNRKIHALLLERRTPLARVLGTHALDRILADFAESSPSAGIQPAEPAEPPVESRAVERAQPRIALSARKKIKRELWRLWSRFKR